MDDFASLISTIERTLRVRCGNYKEDYIRRRLLSRMNATGVQGFRDYQSLLLSSADEQEKLRNALTINVTRFYRDPEVFALVKREVIPRIIERNPRIRIWSAGCSSGEEPYTYAMILAEIGLLRKDVSGIIYATDIDAAILKKAREGVYERDTLENMTESQVRRYFTRKPDGRFEVKPHIREMVRFQQHDLMSSPPPLRNFDLVSCRNVTIYFTEKQKDDLARTFHASLVPGGFYVIGLAEFMGKEVSQLFSPYRPLLKVYTKNGNP